MVPPWSGPSHRAFTSSPTELILPLGLDGRSLRQAPGSGTTQDWASDLDATTTCGSRGICTSPERSWHGMHEALLSLTLSVPTKATKKMLSEAPPQCGCRCQTWHTQSRQKKAKANVLGRAYANSINVLVTAMLSILFYSSSNGARVPFLGWATSYACRFCGGAEGGATLYPPRVSGSESPSEPWHPHAPISRSRPRSRIDGGSARASRIPRHPITAELPRTPGTRRALPSLASLPSEATGASVLAPVIC